jgi:hypothetical protein
MYKAKDRYLEWISDSDFLVGYVWMWDIYEGFLNGILLDLNG